MYKDKDKQREANRTASQRRRDMLKGMTNQGVMDAGMTVAPEIIPKSDIRVIPNHPVPVIPKHQGFTQGKQVLILDGPKKRGKDIKCFEDLPPDVQKTIDIMSMVEGKIDQTIKANRTAIAINYQHTFPERY